MTAPRDLKYRMPAEWEPHAATWLSWPHNEASWPGKLAAIQPVYAQMVAALAASEPVHINVNDLEMERQAQQHLQKAGAQGEIHFHHFPTNDAWCRDHGAIFLVCDRDVGQRTKHSDTDFPPLPLGEGPGVRASEPVAPSSALRAPSPPRGRRQRASYNGFWKAACGDQLELQRLGWKISARSRQRNPATDGRRVGGPGV